MPTIWRANYEFACVEPIEAAQDLERGYWVHLADGTRCVAQSTKAEHFASRLDAFAAVRKHLELEEQRLQRELLVIAEAKRRLARAYSTPSPSVQAFAPASASVQPQPQEGVECQA